MIRIIKYKLLNWLLRDICKKSNCVTCNINYDGWGRFCPRNNSLILLQAKQAWRIK